MAKDDQTGRAAKVGLGVVIGARERRRGAAAGEAAQEHVAERHADEHPDSAHEAAFAVVLTITRIRRNQRVLVSDEKWRWITESRRGCVDRTK